MSRKKRIFDIELPDDPAPRVDAPIETPLPNVQRRGPMASAIAENAEALQARASAVAAIRDENDALAHEFVALREAGHVVVLVPLEDVHTHLLVRDRMPGEDIELADLITSIKELGLSNPIRVAERGDGTGYELVQGFRRWSAYRALQDEGEGDWSKIPALVLPASSDVSGLYRRMVDENVIRKDLSFAEMAQAAMNYAGDPGTDANDLKTAVGRLFQSSPYSKRSYIRSFARVLEALGSVLHYPTEIPRVLGVKLAQEIDSEPGIIGRIKDELHDWDNRSIVDELGVLRRYVGLDQYELPDPEAAPAKKARSAATDAAKTKTTFDLRTRQGRVKCTAAVGRLEIKVDRDFSTMDRARLERAIAALIDGLD